MIGRFWYSEALSIAHWIAIGLAALGVCVLTIGLGVAPWISLVLALTFAFYGVLKKDLELGPVVSVTCEILVFLPLAVVVIGRAHWTGSGAFGQSLHDSVFLILAGPLTALPLILFSVAARNVAMSTVGVLQYINPSLQFFCAVIVYSEPFGFWHGLAFPMIWVALALYSAAALRQDRVARRASISSAGVALTEKNPRSDPSANP